MDVDLKDLPIKARVNSCNDHDSPVIPESNLQVVLKHLRGRCSMTVLSRERILNAKLEGWPEIHLEILQTGRAAGLTPEILDVIKDLSVSALRGSQVNVNMEDFNGATGSNNPFPVFLTPKLLDHPKSSPFLGLILNLHNGCL